MFIKDDIGYNAAPAFADLDNDGDYDLLIGSWQSVSNAYENTGTTSSPTWTAKSAWNTPDIGDLEAPAFADLDNDGDYDLLTGTINGYSYAYENIAPLPPVPEASTIIMLSIGLIMITLYMIYKKRK
jgi:large repetitive protein